MNTAGRSVPPVSAATAGARGSSDPVAPLPPAEMPPPPDFTGLTQPDAVVLERYRPALFLVLLGVLAVGGALAVAFLQNSAGQAPHRVLKIIVGAALAAVILARPAWALGLLPLAWVYDLYLPVSPIPIVNGMNLLITSIFIGWAGHRFSERQVQRPPSPWHLPLTLFLVWYLFSVVRSGAMGAGGMKAFVALLPSVWGGLCGLILFFPIYESVRTWKQIRVLALLFCIGSALGLIGLVNEAAGTGFQRRAGGGVGQVNVAAAYFAAATAFGLGLLRSGYRKIWQRGLVLGSFVATSVGLLIPASRGAYVGLLVGGLLAAFRAGIIWVLVLCALVGAFLLWAPDYAKERITTTEQAASEEGDRVGALNKSAGGRIDFWVAALDVISKNPILGVGYNRLPPEIGKRIGRNVVVHNLYLETAAETGVPGLILLLWLFVAGLAGSAPLLRVPGFPRALGLGYQSAILVLLVSNIFGGRFYAFNLAGMVSLLTVLVLRARALLRDGISEADEAAREHLKDPAISLSMAGGR